MADDTTRIINLTEATEVSDGMYLVTDASTGTRKLSLQKVLDKVGGNVADNYDATATYEVGDFCIYNNLLYECTTAITTAEAWNSTHWIQTDIGEQIVDTENNLNALTKWQTTFKKSVAYNETKFLYIYARKDDLISIVSSVSSGSISVALHDSSGTMFVNVLRPKNGEVRLRATRDVQKVSVYNGQSDATTITVTVTPSDLQIANYYDKSAKVSGYLNNSGVVVSGYYHSDFIPCAIGETFIFSGYPSTFGNPKLFFFDKNKNYVARTYDISSQRAGGLYEYELTYDRAKSGLNVSDSNNIYYVVINMSTSGSDTAVFYRNNVPDTVNAYGLVSPNANAFFNYVQKEYIGSSGASPINGKKITYNGDSISESRLTAGNSYNGGSYPKMIADLTGGTYENLSHGGGILASAVPSGTMPHSVVNTLTNMADDADLICLEGGINDYWRNVPLGDYTESDYSSTLDTTTVCGALESIFRQAKQKWIGKPICFVIVHKIKSTVYVANTAGYTFAQVREKMIGICNKYAIPYYDAYAKSGLNAYDDIQNTTFLTSNSSGIADGCHPNENGYKKYYVPQLIALFNKIIPRN